MKIYITHKQADKLWEELLKIVYKKVIHSHGENPERDECINIVKDFFIENLGSFRFKIKVRLKKEKPELFTIKNKRKVEEAINLLYDKLEDFYQI